METDSRSPSQDILDNYNTIERLRVPEEGGARTQKKNILEGIKDTDNKIKKVFDEIIEQRKRTSQFLQTSFEQLKTNSVNHPNQLSSTHTNMLNHTDSHNQSNNNINQSKSYFQDDQEEYIIPTKYGKSNNNNNTNNTNNNNSASNKQANTFMNCSHDSDELLEQIDRKGMPSKKQNQLNILNQQQQQTQQQQQILEQLLEKQPEQQEQQQQHFLLDSLNDSLLSSFHENSVFLQEELLKTETDKAQKLNKPVLSVRETNIDFGKTLLTQKIHRTVELKNLSSKPLKVRIVPCPSFWDVFSLQSEEETICIPEFEIICLDIYVGDNDTSLGEYMERIAFEPMEFSQPQQKIIVTVRVNVIRPELQIMCNNQQNGSIANASNNQQEQVIVELSRNLTCVSCTINELGGMSLLFANPIQMVIEGEIEIVQSMQDHSKITYFPQNFTLRPNESKKVSITVSFKSTHAELTSPYIFCILIKVNDTPLVFPIRVAVFN